MFNLLFWALVLLFSLSSFQYSFVIGGVNRAFMGIYKAVGESAVIAYDEVGENIVPYFEPTIFERNVKIYLDQAILHYVGDYQVSFAYYSPNNGEACEGNCQEANVNFSCAISLTTDFHKSARFVIKEGFHGGK